jgi:hypothetical protein
VRVSDTPWSELRGIRWPRTGLPGIISLCTRRGPGVRDFAAVYGRRPALVMDLASASFDRLVILRRCGRGGGARGGHHPSRRPGHARGTQTRLTYSPRTITILAGRGMPAYSSREISTRGRTMITEIAQIEIKLGTCGGNGLW